jgi:hypothetical protein
MIGFGLVDLGHRHHEGHLGGLGMVYGFARLRHHTVVRGHHEDHDVGRPWRHGHAWQ